MSEQKWRPWTSEDDNRKTYRQTGPHAWRTVKSIRFPWPYCAHCRMVWLKNDASNRAAKKPCQWEED